MSFGRRPLLGLRLSAEPEEVHGPWCAIGRKPDQRPSHLQLVLQSVRPEIIRCLSSGHNLIRSSSSPAGESPVRTIARQPGSRLTARPGSRLAGARRRKPLRESN